MKTTDKPTEEILEYQKKIEAFFPSSSDKMSVIGTLLGMSDLMARFLIKDQKKETFLALPGHIKYAILQTAHFYMLFAKILRNEFSEEGSLCLKHLPTGGESWQTEEDFEERFIYLVTRFYDELKKQNKI